MSDMKYAPYGADDDPFLTHPAGPGQHRFAPMRPQDARAQSYWDSDYAQGQVPAPQIYPDQYAPHSYAHSGHAAQHGQPHYDHPHSQPQPSYEQANYGAREDHAFDYSAPYPGPYNQHGHDQHGHDQHGHEQRSFAPARAQYAPPMPPVSAPQSGNFAPRHVPAPQSYPDHRPASYQQGHPPAPRASFAAPPRASVGEAAPDRQHFAPRQAQGPASYAPQPMPPRPPQGEPAAQGGADYLISARNAGGVMQWAGALCTLAVVVGVALWGYELAMRDANGIPVVRAAEGPMRVAPETPGGEVSAHQGLAVNAIPAAGAAPDAPDEIILAPQTATLSAEDMGTGAAIVQQGSFAQTAGAGSAAALAGASDMMMTQPQTDGGISADLTALPDALPEDMPLSDAEAVERALAAALAEGGDFAASTDAPLASEPATMSQTDPVFPPTAELDPTTIAVGTPMVQLGAFESDAIARTEWANLQTRFTELMAGKALVVEQAKSGGRDFYRLRAHGFASADDTRRFCAAVLAENGSCFPVDQR